MIVTSSERYAATAARVIGTAMTLAVAERGHCAIALTGGTTPGPVYRALALLPDLPWSAVDLFFGDERAVPPDDPESNYRMVAETLLAHAPIPAGQVHRMEAEREDLAASAAAYARLLPPVLDILLLGMGPDGHTASLFPGSAALAETARTVVPVHGPKPPPVRLTITPPVIASARNIYLLITGLGKAAMVARAIEGLEDCNAMPVQLARRGTWLLDDAAAALLHSPGE